MIDLTGVRRMVVGVTGRRVLVVALAVATGALVVALGVGRLAFHDYRQSGWLGGI